MYEFYNGQTVKTLIGKTLTAEELKERPFFAQLFEEECVIIKDEAGRMTSFETLENAKLNLGIPADDKTTGEEAALLLNQKQAERDAAVAEQSATLADIQAQLDALTGAN